MKIVDMNVYIEPVAGVFQENTFFKTENVSQIVLYHGKWSDFIQRKKQWLNGQQSSWWVNNLLNEERRSSSEKKTFPIFY